MSPSGRRICRSARSFHRDSEIPHLGTEDSVALQAPVDDTAFRKRVFRNRILSYIHLHSQRCQSTPQRSENHHWPPLVLACLFFRHCAHSKRLCACLYHNSNGSPWGPHKHRTDLHDMVSDRYALRMARDPHISPHNSNLCRNSYPHIFSRPISCRKSKSEQDPYVNMEDMDRHGKAARKDEGIFLARFYLSHKSVHTNEAVSQKFVEGRLPSHTNNCK